MWRTRHFKVISIKQAKELGLEFWTNVHGDGINLLNCRSLWSDSKNRTYRVQELVLPEMAFRPLTDEEKKEYGNENYPKAL